MNEPKQSTCRSCNAPIYWAKWPETGKNVPIDAAPSPTGNLAVSKPPTGLVVAHWRPDLHASHPRRTSHFATCPNAAEHRKPRPSPKPYRAPVPRARSRR